jgi:hypothetical protein
MIMGILKWFWDLIVMLVTVPFAAYEEDMDFWEWIVFIFFSMPLAICTFWFFPALIVLWFVNAFNS